MLKNAFVPGTCIGRLSGKGGCKIGIWLGTAASDWWPPAIKGGGTQNCNACVAAVPAKIGIT